MGMSPMNPMEEGENSLGFWFGAAPIRSPTAEETPIYDIVESFRTTFG